LLHHIIAHLKGTWNLLRENLVPRVIVSRWDPILLWTHHKIVLSLHDRSFFVKIHDWFWFISNPWIGWFLDREALAHQILNGRDHVGNDFCCLDAKILLLKLFVPSLLHELGLPDRIRWKLCKLFLVVHQNLFLSKYHRWLHRRFWFSLFRRRSRSVLTDLWLAVKFCQLWRHNCWWVLRLLLTLEWLHGSYGHFWWWDYVLALSAGTVVNLHNDLSHLAILQVKGVIRSRVAISDHVSWDDVFVHRSYFWLSQTPLDSLRLFRHGFRSHRQLHWLLLSFVLRLPSQHGLSFYLYRWLSNLFFFLFFAVFSLPLSRSDFFIPYLLLL